MTSLFDWSQDIISKIKKLTYYITLCIIFDTIYSILFGNIFNSVKRFLDGFGLVRRFTVKFK